MELTKKDIVLFKRLAQTTEKTLLRTMATYLKRHYGEDKTIVNKKYVYAIGDIPITLVAHVDTVFCKPPQDIYYDSEQNVMWSPDGLGADDRAGVFAIIKIIQAKMRPHIIFTTGEEMGAIGAGVLTTHYPDAFADMKYIIQLDRRGYNDCVFYDCANREFEDYIVNFGFKKATGSFSDISELCPSWGVAGVNLSIGYIDEHSVLETFHLNCFTATLNKVIKMLQSANEAPHFKYIHNLTNFMNFDKNWYSNTKIKCAKCGKFHLDYEMFNVKNKDYEMFYCSDCLVDDVEWCDRCGEAFVITEENKNSRLCWDCQEEENNVGTSEGAI